jgi:hypothetical protein
MEHKCQWSRQVGNLRKPQITGRLSVANSIVFGLRMTFVTKFHAENYPLDGNENKELNGSAHPDTCFSAYFTSFFTFKENL